MIYIGADHRGFDLKEDIKRYLSSLGYRYEDIGNAVKDPDDDYPDFASKVAQKVSEDPEQNVGIVICGTGFGVDITANKFRGVRSALVWEDSKELVKRSRQDDLANVLSLPADYMNEEDAKSIVKTWLQTPYSTEERFLRRAEKIRKIEESTR